MAYVPEGSTEEGRSHIKAIGVENLEKSNLKVKKRYETKQNSACLYFNVSSFSLEH